MTSLQIPVLLFFAASPEVLPVSISGLHPLILELPCHLHKRRPESRYPYSLQNRIPELNCEVPDFFTICRYTSLQHPIILLASQIFSQQICTINSSTNKIFLPSRYFHYRFKPSGIVPIIFQNFGAVRLFSYV